MALSRLLNIVLLLLMVCAVAGFLSIQAEMTAVASAAKDQETLVSSVNGKQPMVIAAELMPEDRELLILPEIPDLLVKNGRGVTELNATCQVDDGRLYAWQGLHRTRIWLFAVITDEKPTVTIDPQSTRHPPVTSAPLLVLDPSDSDDPRARESLPTAVGRLRTTAVSTVDAVAPEGLVRCYPSGPPFPITGDRSAREGSGP